MLPGLAPHHTRAGFIGGNRLRVEKYAPELGSYTRTESGLWLLPAEVAEKEAKKGVEKLGVLADAQSREDMDVADHTRGLQDILSSSSVSNTGCLTGGLPNGQGVAATVLSLAEHEMRTFSLDVEDDLKHLRVCDCRDCYNPRHFDLSFGRPTLRERKVELNPDWFTFLESGRVKTIWEDILPSVARSLEYYIQMQRWSYPFTNSKESLLTPGSSSQIRFHPLTGCWESWSYYCRPEGNLNWQFDGYGRLYRNYKIKRPDPETGELKAVEERGHYLAHRVTWAASPGRYLKKDHHLNHKCSYRRCCNPLHIEQVPASKNVRHGVGVQSAIKLAEVGGTGSADNFLTAEQLVPYHEAARAMYLEICKSKGLPL
jgi:hypothetical protein